MSSVNIRTSNPSNHLLRTQLNLLHEVMAHGTEVGVTNNPEQAADEPFSAGPSHVDITKSRWVSDPVEIVYLTTNIVGPLRDPTSRKQRHNVV